MPVGNERRALITSLSVTVTDGGTGSGGISGGAADGCFSVILAITSSVVEAMPADVKH